MSNSQVCSLPRYCTTSNAQISVPVAIMRAKPNDKSEILSQAIFGEEIRVIDKTFRWAKIETIADGYIGWIRKKEYYLKKNSKEIPHPKSFIIVCRPSAHVYHVKDTIYGPLMTLPYESRLEMHHKDHDDRWLAVVLPHGKVAYIQRGDVSSEQKKMSMEEVCRFSRNFLGLPYTWGGRSSFGYDCSGFVQMLYRHLGIRLPRDSQDQCHWKGFVEVGLEQVKPGNLVFFGTSSDHIKHVGFCLGDNEFIHATVGENLPHIRVSKHTDEKWSGKGDFPYRCFKSLN